jgi:hypothetical protein
VFKDYQFSVDNQLALPPRQEFAHGADSAAA